MIEQADWLLVGGLVGVSVTVTFFLSSVYYAQRVYEIHRDHVHDMQDSNDEIIALRAKLAARETRDRIMGSVPVGRLLDD